MRNKPPRKENKGLNFAEMIRHIDRLVNSDFGFDMECKQLPNTQPYTQEEARRMAKLISNIYSISHCRTCTACQGKWRKK